ncbi:MAG: hypothetical protein OSJ43_15255 [Oscillospiraceae bacterium]|nr:hypothetical protein [Oscillospiraceae bacterium]
MNKYLVDVYLPASGEHFDVFLPINKLIGEVISLLADIAVPLSGNSFKRTTDTVLINAANGEVYNFNDTVFDAGIRNSTKLILI